MSRKPVIDVAPVGRRGAITLSRRSRAALGREAGDQLLLSVDAGRLVIERRRRHLGASLDALAGSAGRRDG